MLYDIGLRASELCGLRLSDLDMTQRKVTVLGKGNKTRALHLGTNAMKALWTYLGPRERDPERPLFCCECGPNRGSFLNRGSLRDIIERLNFRAEITGVRVSPHTFRHSYAIGFLRRGGSIEALKELLGHTDIKMTIKYAKFVEADLEAQRRFSPADNIKPGSVLSGRGGKSAPKSKPALPPGAERHARATGAAKVTRAKITETDVSTIRQRLAGGESRQQVAEDYGVSRTTIKELVLGYTWGHVK